MYYENPTMLSRVIARNIGDVFLRHSVYFDLVRVSDTTLGSRFCGERRKEIKAQKREKSRENWRKG